MSFSQEMLGLEGKLAIITGASGHLGSVFSRALASVGSNCILIDRDKETLDILAAALRDEFNIQATVYECNLSNDQQIKEMTSNVLDRYEKIDVLINNAGYTGTSDLDGWTSVLADHSNESWSEALNVNVSAALKLVRDWELPLRKAEHASVINISSIYGIRGPRWGYYEGLEMKNPAAYSASKAAMLQLSKWLATYLVPSVRVNSISPGGIERAQDPLFVERYVKDVPLGRMATEDDMVGAMLFLAGRMSLYVTGQNIVVDGGWSL